MKSSRPLTLGGWRLVRDSFSAIHGRVILESCTKGFPSTPRNNLVAIALARGIVVLANCVFLMLLRELATAEGIRLALTPTQGLALGTVAPITVLRLAKDLEQVAIPDELA